MFETAKILFVVDRSAVCDSFASQVATVVTRLDAELTVFNMDQAPQQGDLAEQIVNLADAGDVDLIMMAAQEPGIVRRLFGPSTLHKVLRQCRCAVWTAQGPQALAKAKFSKIACAVDLSADSVRVLSAAGTLAKQWNCDLAIVHAMPEMDESLLQLAALNDLPVTLSQKVVRDEVAKLQSLASTSAGLHIETSDVRKGVRRALHRLDADLLVIGPGRNAAKFGASGSNVKTLVRAASCPVLVLEKIAAGPRLTKDVPVEQPMSRSAKWSGHTR